IRIRPASWMQSTGQTSTQERSLMSMQGSAMMYVTAPPTVARRAGPSGRDELVDELAGPLDERRLRHDLVEAGRVRGPQAGRVGVIRVAQDRHVRVRIGHLLRVEPRHVDDHEVGSLGVLDGDQPVPGQERLELPPEVEVDPTE